MCMAESSVHRGSFAAEVDRMSENESKRYNCGLLNCGDGKCVHELTDELCPYCKMKMVLVKTNGFKFCSSHDAVCDYEDGSGLFDE